MHRMLILIGGAATILAMLVAVMVGFFAIGYVIGAVLAYMF